jgi:hypothetical protein
MSCGTTGNLAAFNHLSGDQFDGPPIPLVAEQVFGFGQEPAFEPFRSPFAGPLDGKSAYIPPVLSGLIPGIVSGVPGLGREAAQGDEHFLFEPILRRPNNTFAKLAPPEPLAIRQYANALHRPAERQRHDRVARFVVGRGFAIRRFHANSLHCGLRFQS